MRPAGLRPASTTAGSEVDALQADVMRFVAIIGLSLAAIFSLLQEAEQSALLDEQKMAQAAPIEQRVAKQTAVPDRQEAEQKALAEQQPVARAAKETPPAPPEPVPAPSPGPQAAAEKPALEQSSPPRPDSERPPRAPDAPAGFSLSFASEQALMQLLLRQEVAVYAISGDTFWAYDAAGKSFAAAQPPSAYHEMEASTVPSALRNWMAAAGVEVERWGVLLPPATVHALDRHMSQQHSGELLIDSAGQVTSGAGPLR